jgi:cytochrome c-type biogenesis protein
MLILLSLAFLSGLATAIAPCVLPILPILLSTGTGISPYRRYAIIGGLLVSFVCITLFLALLPSSLGIDRDSLRTLASYALMIFGATLLIPRLHLLFEQLVSRLKFQPNQPSNSLLGGFMVGCTLGIIWTPCTGPLMAAVVSLAATQGVSSNTFFITLAYGIGACLPLLAFLSLANSHTVLRSIAPHSQRIQRLFGLLLVASSLAIFSGFDRTAQSKILDILPPSLYSGVTQGLEQTILTPQRLDNIP